MPGSFSERLASSYLKHLSHDSNVTRQLERLHVPTSDKVDVTFEFFWTHMPDFIIPIESKTNGTTKLTGVRDREYGKIAFLTVHLAGAA